MQTVSSATYTPTSIQFGATKAQAKRSMPRVAHDSVHFGSDANPHDDAAKKSGFTGARKAIWNDLKSPKWWGTQLAVSTAITLATCWLPGSQLATIPAWFAISMVYSGFEGYHRKNQAKPPKAQPAPEEKAGDFGFLDKAQGALKGAVKGSWQGVKNNIGRDLLFGGALTLATCWLPGTQIIIIPAFMCVSAAMGAVSHAHKGWKNPKAV